MNAPSASPLRRVSVIAGIAVLASLSGAACSSSDDGIAPSSGDGSEGEAIATEQEVRASCTRPRRYFATFRDGSGTCDPIPGKRGTWVPGPLFADAPADVQASTCAYTWAGARYARPDRDAIAAKVGYANALAAACGSGSQPDVGLIEAIPALEYHAQVGSVGCDVCGIVDRGKVWVVLPPEKVASKQFQVSLDNGQTRAFQIQATDARALTIALPPPPAGTQYESGRVLIY